MTAPALSQLAPTLAGSLYVPGDPDFERLATPWNVAATSMPAAVVVPADVADLCATISYAASAGLDVAPRTTGHGAAGDDLSRTILVRTDSFDEIAVHDGWMRVGAGVTWQTALDAACPAGFAPLCGSAPGVGVVGYLTGGGLGPLARTFGLSSDHVSAIEVVTGDGVWHRATESEDTALFWALCGGKGALGVVTAIEFDIPQLAEIYGGCAYFDAADAAGVLDWWRDWSAALPSSANTSLAFMRMPPMPGVPQPLAGRCTVAVRFGWVGDPADGARSIAELTARFSPVLGGYGVMPYHRIGEIHADPVDPMPVHEDFTLLASLPSTATAALLAVAGPTVECPLTIVELRRLGGEIPLPSGDDVSAVCHRDAAYSLSVIGVDAPGVGDLVRRAADGVVSALEPFGGGRRMPNFAASADPDALRRAYTPEVLARLGTLVTSYDPHCVIHDAALVRRACLMPE